MRTKLSKEQLVINAKALGFNPACPAALAGAAMVSDPDFRERLTRLYFEKALREIKGQ